MVDQLYRAILRQLKPKFAKAFQNGAKLDYSKLFRDIYFHL